jgi:hypothetical protein
VLLLEGNPLPGRRFMEIGRGSLELEQGFLELQQGSLKLVQRHSFSAVSAATWWERSSIPCRSVALSGGGPTLTSAVWGVTSEMRSVQRAAESKLPSGWPARMA